MKFHWFNLMPWPHLPDDFTEKHRSVWELDQPTAFARLVSEFLGDNKVARVA